MVAVGVATLVSGLVLLTLLRSIIAKSNEGKIRVANISPSLYLMSLFVIFNFISFHFTITIVITASAWQMVRSSIKVFMTLVVTATIAIFVAFPLNVLIQPRSSLIMVRLGAVVEQECRIAIRHSSADVAIVFFRDIAHDDWTWRNVS